MPVLTAQRASERDAASLDRLSSEASKSVSLWSQRRERFNPGAWLASRAPLVLVVEGGSAIGFGVALSDSLPLGSTKCAEALVYVTPANRRRGGGRAALSELLMVARTMGVWKLVAYSLAEDPAPRPLLDRADFRAVGTLVKHQHIEGAWRDVVLHERLVMAARKSLPSISDL